MVTEGWEGETGGRGKEKETVGKREWQKMERMTEGGRDRRIEMKLD